VVGVSGGSGAPIAVRVLKALHEAGRPVELVVTDGARAVLAEEVGLGAEDLAGFATHLYGEGEMAVPIASGSTPTSGMVVVPCSANTLAQVALGLAGNLLTRVAHVHLKEHRPLVLVPRETPLDAILLGHMTRLAELGVVILIDAPPYYLHPRSVDDLTDYVAGKVLDHLGVPHHLYSGYRGRNA
jgi:flavin prenyltransferase